MSAAWGDARAVRGRWGGGSKGGQVGRGIWRARIWCGGLCGIRVGEGVFVKNDVTRNYDATGTQVQAPIPLMLEGIANENAPDRARG